MPEVIYAFTLNRISDIDSDNKDHFGLKLEQFIAEGTGENLPVKKHFDNFLIKITENIKKISPHLKEIQKEIVVKSKVVFPLFRFFKIKRTLN